MIRPIARFLLVFLLSGFLLHGQEVLINQVYNSKTGSSIRVTAMSNQLPSSGYLAVRVNVRNGEKIPASWSFNFTSKDHSWDNYNQLTSSFSLSCAAGRQKNVELLVPLVTAIQDDSPLVLEVAVTASPPLSGSRVEMQTEHQHGWPNILMSEVLHTPNSSTLDATMSSGSRSRYGSGTFAGSFLPRDLSEDWRAYAGYDIIMLTSADWSSASPGAKNAVLQWNRLGGRIIIYATTPSVTLASLAISEGGSSDRSTTRTWGEVDLLNLPAKNLLNARDTASMVRRSQLQPQASLFGAALASSWPLQDDFGERSFNPAFFIVILIVFGIIVGPVNLFVFAKSGQRHRLFITTPIISLTASALLLLIIVFQDGFGGKGHRLALVEIQPDENTAYIHQQQIARTGVLLKTSFNTKDHAIVSPVALDESRWARITPRNGGGESRYRISEGEKNTQKLSGDWYKSRSEYGHLITSIQATRGRLELLDPNGAPTLTSTFDFPLEKIYYRDSSGSVWQSSSALSSGRKAQLAPCPPEDFDSWLKQQKEVLDDSAEKRLDLLAERPNHFIALSEEGPFTDTLSSLNWKESTAVITGPVVTP